MTDAIKEAVEMADKHGAEHRFEHNGTLEVLRFEPEQLAALIAEVRREEKR